MQLNKNQDHLQPFPLPKHHKMQTTSPPPLTTTTTEPKDPDLINLALELEDLSTAGIAAVNSRDWACTSPRIKRGLSHLSQDFRAQPDNFPGSLTFEENMASSRFLAEQDASFQLEIVHISTNIETNRRFASVWIEMNVSGISPGVVMKGFSELKWRLCGDDGRWYCYRHLGMRGGLV